MQLRIALLLSLMDSGGVESDSWETNVERGMAARVCPGNREQFTLLGWATPLQTRTWALEHATMEINLPLLSWQVDSQKILFLRIRQTLMYVSNAILVPSIHGFPFDTATCFAPLFNYRRFPSFYVIHKFIIC
jgi:hypothetical protein